jgi:hypothetical protein
MASFRTAFGCLRSYEDYMPTENQTARESRFDVPLAIHCPPSMREAVGLAAQREMLSISAFIRRVLRDKLRADGLLNR